MACLSLLSFFTRRKMASPKGVSFCRAEKWFRSSRILRCTSNCSMSKNPATHNRRPHAKTNRWGTIPQSAKLTAPFTQRGLWCGAPPKVRAKIATPPHEPLSRLWRQLPLQGSQFNVAPRHLIYSFFYIIYSFLLPPPNGSPPKHSASGFGGEVGERK